MQLTLGISIILTTFVTLDLFLVVSNTVGVILLLDFWVLFLYFTEVIILSLLSVLLSVTSKLWIMISYYMKRTFKRTRESAEFPKYCSKVSLKLFTFIANNKQIHNFSDIQCLRINAVALICSLLPRKFLNQRYQMLQLSNKTG